MPYEVSNFYAPGVVPSEYESTEFHFKDSRAADFLSYISETGPFNLMQYASLSTLTVSGVAFKINEDGSITADGTATNKKATANILFKVGEVHGQAGKTLILSGCPSGGNYTSGYAVYCDRISDSRTIASQEDPYSETEFTPDADFRVRIMIRNGTVVDNVTFRPVVRDAKLTKYLQSVNRELVNTPWGTMNNAKIQNALVKYIDDGPKNILKIGCQNKSVSGVTLTNNNDGSVTINGTNSGSGSIILVSDLSSTVNNVYDGRGVIARGMYVVPKVADNLRIQVYEHNGTQASMTAIANNVDNSVFNYTGSKTYVTARILIEAGGSFSNLTFYPMICPLVYWLISQTPQPYRPSYQELYDMVKALQT